MKSGCVVQIDRSWLPNVPTVIDLLRRPPHAPGTLASSESYVSFMPSDLFLKAMNSVHRLVLASTRGRAGWTAGGMPVLSLTTTGRKSGRRRSVLLTVPARDGDALVLVASRGGDNQSPAWFLNLVANPNVDVSLQGAPPVRMNARVATPPERARLWPVVIAGQPRYRGYQLRTEREIPLILLQRVE
jgi:deazaflavin-dependent oxidoreductase (nitroreductase family)